MINMDDIFSEKMKNTKVNINLRIEEVTRILNALDDIPEYTELKQKLKAVIFTKVERAIFTDNKNTETAHDNPLIEEWADLANQFKVPDEFFKTLNLEYEIEKGNLNDNILSEMGVDCENIKFMIGKQGQLGVRLTHKNKDIMEFFINNGERECLKEKIKTIGWSYSYKRYVSIKDNDERELFVVNNISLDSRSQRALSVMCFDNTIVFTKTYKNLYEESIELTGNYLLTVFFLFVINN